MHPGKFIYGISTMESLVFMSLFLDCLVLYLS